VSKYHKIVFVARKTELDNEYSGQSAHMYDQQHGST